MRQHSCWGYIFVSINLERGLAGECEQSALPPVMRVEDLPITGNAYP